MSLKCLYQKRKVERNTKVYVWAADWGFLQLVNKCKGQRGGGTRDTEHDMLGISGAINN